MPGRRKFRLSTRKNYERKKYKTAPEHLRVSIPLDQVTLSSTDGHDRDHDTRLIVSIPRNIYLSSSAPNLVILKERMTKPVNLFPNWSIQLSHPPMCDEPHLQMCQSEYLFEQPLRLTLRSDFRWSIRLKEVLVNPPITESTIGSVTELESFLQKLKRLRACVGNPDEKYEYIRKLKNGRFVDHTGTKTIAYYDEGYLFSHLAPTIRHSDCLILAHRDRCQVCEEYRSNLNSLLSRAKRRRNTFTDTDGATAMSSIDDDYSSTRSHVNYRFLSTPQKIDRIRALKKQNIAMSLRLRRMRDKIEAAIEKGNVTCLDEDMSIDLCQIMEEQDSFVFSNYPEKSFPHIFWKAQKDHISKQGKMKNGIRWHPLLIKWCLFLKHQSSKAYETIRQSGICLPSQRTLRDYSNAVKAGAGFSIDVDSQILQAARLLTSPHYHRLVVILIDEMHVKEDLVYNKHTGHLVGFVDLGDINNHLAAYEKALEADDDDDSDDYEGYVVGPSLAKSIVAFMVRGLFTKFKFPYAQFPCVNLSGEQLFFPFWECIERLERIGFKVLAATFDGASVNRRLVAIHDTSEQLIYKIRNIYADDEDRHVFFFSDPPHLVKTVRNCWNSKHRSLWKDGKHILWQHLLDLYHQDNGKGSGLALVPKLKYEHCFLTKMRVDLAAQVLSESVAKALRLNGLTEVEETATFTAMFDKFFDLLNVSNFYNHKRSRKPAQKPYTRPDDDRLKWLTDVFLKYLSDWENSVKSRPGKYSEAEKKRMLLSSETLLGIKRTVKSFVEFIPFLMSLPEVKEQRLSFLSQNLCQDALENYFGCQRQIGGTSDNPSVSDYLTNTQSLRVVDSFCRGPLRGNCGRGTHKQNQFLEQQDDSKPLIKRRKTKPLN